MRRARSRATILLGALAVVLAIGSSADIAPPPEVTYPNVPYNGRFTFVRLRFTPSRWRPGNYAWGLDLGWNHDYPRGENHFVKILKETTSIEANDDGNVLALDDPELFKYPVAYICEVGLWTLTDKEAEALRNYLLKGGFLIVDDFVGRDWDVFADQMHRVLPSGRFVELDKSHPLFQSFFRMEALPATHPYRRWAIPSYRGIFEDNDPQKRLLMIVNYNNDVSEYWEWSDTNWLPIDLSNEAYKLGVNYVVYGMTH